VKEWIPSQPPGSKVQVETERTEQLVQQSKNQADEKRPCRLSSYEGTKSWVAEQPANHYSSASPGPSQEELDMQLAALLQEEEEVGYGEFHRKRQREAEQSEQYIFDNFEALTSSNPYCVGCGIHETYCECSDSESRPHIQVTRSSSPELSQSVISSSCETIVGDAPLQRKSSNHALPCESIEPDTAYHVQFNPTSHATSSSSSAVRISK
jgi:hypothetical protein